MNQAKTTKTYAEPGSRGKFFFFSFFNQNKGKGRGQKSKKHEITFFRVRRKGVRDKLITVLCVCVGKKAQDNLRMKKPEGGHFSNYMI